MPASLAETSPGARHDRELDPFEPLPHGIRRVALNQYDKMLTGLRDTEEPDAGVHGARKAMKRQRALLRLVRDEIGYAGYRAENVVLRDAARALAPVRDGAVQAQTLQRVRREYDAWLNPEVFSTFSAFLVESWEAARRGVLEDRALMVDVKTTLMTAKRRTAAWDGRVARPPGGRCAALGMRDSFSAIEPGLHRVYRRGLRGMTVAAAEPDTDTLHEWRKRVKYLRYQLEALRPVWPELIDAHTGRLDTLGEQLGDEHDLALLEETAWTHGEAFTDERERTLLVVLTQRLRGELRYEAFRLGRSLYSESPDAFVDRIAGYWYTATT